MTTLLGLSALGPRGGAVLVRDGRVLAARREPARGSAPTEVNSRAARACLDAAGVPASQVDWVVVAGKPLRGFERFLETEIALAPAGYASFKKRLPWWAASGLFAARTLDKELGLSRKSYVWVPTIEAHLALAHHHAGAQRCALLAIDDADWCGMALGSGDGDQARLLEQLHFPHSPALLHSAMLAHLGLAPGDERGFEALAVAGEARHAQALRERVLQLGEDGSILVDGTLLAGESIDLDKLGRLAGLAPRHPLDALEAAHADLAASWAAALEDLCIAAARRARQLVDAPVLAVGGAAFVRNRLGGRFLAECGFERVHLAPAADGLSAALGAVLHTRHALLKEPRDDHQPTTPAPASGELDQLALRLGLRGGPCADPLEEARATLLEGGAVALCLDGAELSPEALSTRCVLSLPRGSDLRRAQRALAGFGTTGLPIVCALADEAPRLVRSAPGATFDGLREATLVEGGARVRLHLVDGARHPRLAGLLDALRGSRGTSLCCIESLSAAAAQHGDGMEALLRTFLAARIELCVADGRAWRRAEQPAVRAAQAPVADPALSASWACPGCGGTLARAGDAARCAACGRAYAREEGIWRFFHPHEPMQGDVTEAVKAFYEKQPFPHYDERESVQTLLAKSRRGIYARLLDEQIPHDATVLEVGCGTGQLSNFLGIGARRVTGADLCLNSLRLAEGFRSSQGLDNVRFVQMNLFKPAFAPASFDVVMCNGVLHHTADPYGGFVGISKLVKPGGHIVIGLYNQYGRLLLDARRKVFQATGGRMRWIDGYIRTTKMSRDKQESWFNDQYRHPHESKHTMGEVLEWFDKNGFDFVHGVPPLVPWDDFTTEERLFEPASSGTALDRGLAQARMIISGSREGGFYIMIGKKRGGS